MLHVGHQDVQMLEVDGRRSGSYAFWLSSTNPRRLMRPRWSWGMVAGGSLGVHSPLIGGDRNPSVQASLLIGRISLVVATSDKSLPPTREHLFSHSSRCLLKVFGLGCPRLGLGRLSNCLRDGQLVRVSASCSHGWEFRFYYRQKDGGHPKCTAVYQLRGTTRPRYPHTPMCYLQSLTERNCSQTKAHSVYRFNAFYEMHPGLTYSPE